jgi:oligoendopeptidase F
MKNNFPIKTETLLKWTWGDIEPYFQDLLAYELNAENVDVWLKNWSDLTRHVHEFQTRLHIRTMINTADKEGERLYTNFLDTVFPKAEKAENDLNQKLLDSKLEPKNIHIALRNIRAEADLFREENLPLISEEEKIKQECQKIMAAQTVKWENEERTISQMSPLQLENDRAAREKAMRLVMERQHADFEALGELWTQIMNVRRQIASNAGKANFRDYQWQNKQRFDYTPENAKSFNCAVEEVVVPVASRIHERWRKKLGVETLCLWDTQIDHNGLNAIRPFANTDELIHGMQRVFDKVDPVFGRRFQTMVAEGLLDLENQKYKAPGGYCTTLAVSRQPFIFMNTVGSQSDVTILLHEVGHSFHVFETAEIDPVHNIKYSLGEFNEVAAMAMVHLAWPYLIESGMYTETEVARARIRNLESILISWPIIAMGDAMQHWIYENQVLASNPVKVGEKWSRIWNRYIVGVDWGGLEQYKATSWQRNLNFYLYPLHSIQYGLAQFGAAQIWANSIADYSGVIKTYRKALSLGGTVTLPELYAAAGAKFSFDSAILRHSVQLMEQTIEELESRV